VAAAVRAQDPEALTANVSWAAAEPVPMWLDLLRELSERWIHRQQLRQALGRPGDLRPDLAEPVLDGLRWAYRHYLSEGSMAQLNQPGILAASPRSTAASRHRGSTSKPTTGGPLRAGWPGRGRDGADHRSSLATLRRTRHHSQDNP
jgi:hypothetical protein